MRKVVVAMVALALPFVGAGPASADPARASAAAAFGLAGAGLLNIPPTPVARASQPPDTDIPLAVPAPNFNAVIPLDVGGLAVTGTVNAAAQATRASGIQAVLPDVNDNVNARGFARTDGLQLLGDATLLEAIGLNIEDNPALLSAGLIEAEAVATCVNNQPVFDASSRIIGDLRLLEIDLAEIVDPILGGVIDLLDLPGLIQIQRGDEDPSLTVRTAESITITALRISILGTTQVLDISQATAAMPANCAVAPPAAEPTGPGAIAPTLAATGGSDLILPVAFGMLVTGFGLRRLNRRSRRENAAA